MSIETKQYIASDKDIETLAGEILDVDQAASSKRGIYFKAAIATTQAELKSPPRQRNVTAEKLSAAEIEEHLKAFEAVAERFHAAVVRVAEATVPDPDAKMRRKRTRYSHSALSTIRGFIRAGNDIRAVAAHKATKAALATPMRKRKPSVDQLKRQVGTLGTALHKLAKQLCGADREIALETLRPILAQLATAAGVPASGKVFALTNLSAARESRRAA